MSLHEPWAAVEIDAALSSLSDAFTTVYFRPKGPAARSSASVTLDARTGDVMMFSVGGPADAGLTLGDYVAKAREFVRTSSPATA